MSSFLPQEFIRQIRDGEPADDEDMRRFIAGIGDGSVSDAQVAAFTMAVYFNNLAMPQRVALTTAMRDSGDVLDWSHLDGPVLDKHSTGGVGDNVSLILGPVVAACGGYVPMISGRGLGHTGGTLDKFDAIPGYCTAPDNELFRATVKQVGCAIIGQTGQLAPADKKIYAIRSATASVENISLITASILSKKLAAGLEGLVLDIKCGSGAFMADYDSAKELAISLVEVANGAGVKTSGLITDMNEPLASCTGNAIEMLNAIKHLTATARDERLHKVVVELSAEMLLHGKLAVSIGEARAKINQVLDSGAAAEVFARMVSALGGPDDLMDKPENYLEAAPLIADVITEAEGVVSAIDARSIGLAVIVLGGGRKRPDDDIDYAVGFDRLAGIGTQVKKGDVIGRVHGRTQNQLQEGAMMLRNAYMFGEAAPQNPLIVERING
jgi:thymidine phosphorylase